MTAIVTDLVHGYRDLMDNKSGKRNFFFFPFAILTRFAVLKGVRERGSIGSPGVYDIQVGQSGANVLKIKNERPRQNQVG